MQLWEVGTQGTGRTGVSTQLSPLHRPLPQAAKIITYKEPDNPEYLEFLQKLKHLAHEQFNFTMEDGLVGGVPGTLQRGPPAPSSQPSASRRPALSAIPVFPGLPFFPFPLFPYLS